MAEKNYKSINKEYVLGFVLLLFLCFLFPYTGDDWAWGSSIGIERLNQWFDNYSGRYLGNLIVLVLTRSNILKTITMATCLIGIVRLLDKLTGNSKVGFYFSVGCILLMPVAVLRQAIVWTAGFSNYTTSIFLTLIYIYYVKAIFEEGKPKYSKMSVIGLFFLGIANTLIVEHLTIYNVILGFFVVLVAYVRYKKIFLQHVAYSLGTIVGTIYMFSNSCYRSVATGQDGYRTIGSEEGVISKAFHSYFDVIVQEGFLNNVVLNVCLCIICVILWSELKERIELKNKVIGQMCVWIIVAYAVTSVVNMISGIQQLKLLKYAEGVATLVYIISWIVLVAIVPIAGLKKLKLLFILGSTGCMIAPLLVVSPIGSRCFFATYIMQIYFLLELYTLISVRARRIIYKNTKLLALVCCVSYLYLCYIYGMIFVSDVNRVKSAKKSEIEGATVIRVENLPYEKYVWCSRPQKDTVWEERFKLFYGIDSDIAIETKESHYK